MLLRQEDSSRLVQERNDGSGRVLHWEIKPYNRTRFKETTDVFKEINGFWASLPRDTLEGIWDCYCAMHAIFKAGVDTDAKTEQLKGWVTSLYKLMPFEKVKYYMMVNNFITYPNNIKTALGPDDFEGRTFLIGHYEELISLAVWLRPMVPIWGEYITAIQDEVGTHWKEIKAIRLMADTELDRGGMAISNKIYTYAYDSTEAAEDLSGTTIDFMGKSEIPDYLYATAIVRRITGGSLEVTDGGGSLVTNVYAFVDQTLKRSPQRQVRKFAARINKDSDEEKDKSYLENCRVKEKMSTGDTAINRVYATMCASQVLRYDANFPMVKLDLCLENIQGLPPQTMNRFQVALVQYTMTAVISPRSIERLKDVNEYLRIAASAQALLWHWGYPDLAALITAKSDGERDFIGVGSRNQLPVEIVEQLNKMYPYEWSANRQKVKTRQDNTAIQAIHAIASGFSAKRWSAKVPQELAKDCAYLDTRLRIQNIPDIYLQLGRFVLDPRRRFVERREI